MATFTTITEHKIYTLALFSLMEQKERELGRHHAMLFVSGRPNAISAARIQKLNLQIDELHEAILALEAKGEC